MRALSLLLLIAAVLAGCTGPASDPEPDPADATAPLPPGPEPEALGGDGGWAQPGQEVPRLDEPVELASATLPWHQDDVDGTYFRVVQVLMNPCLSDHSGRAEPYSNNLPVSQRTEVLPLPAGTRALEVTLDWSGDDYGGDALVLAYREGRDWRTSDYLPKGTSVVDLQDVAEPVEADLWLCVWGAESEYGNLSGQEVRSFSGDVTVTLRALGTDA